MVTGDKDQEKEALVMDFEEREAGVADLMELYERVEAVYDQASASAVDSEFVYTSDSTSKGRAVADVG